MVSVCEFIRLFVRSGCLSVNAITPELLRDIITKCSGHKRYNPRVQREPVLNCYITQGWTGLVGSGQNYRKIWRVWSGRIEISEMHYVNFAVYVVLLIEIVMKKCYISTLAKLQ